VFITLEDESGTANLLVFPNSFQQYRKQIPAIPRALRYLHFREQIKHIKNLSKSTEGVKNIQAEILQRGEILNNSNNSKPSKYLTGLGEECKNSRQKNRLKP
jgi:hypothetical protein